MSGRPHAAVMMIVAALAAGTLAGMAPVAAATGRRPVVSLDGGRGQRVGAAPAVPAGARPLGALPPAARMDFDIVLRPRDPGGLSAFAAGVSTAGSPLYRHFLTTAGFARRFGQPRAVTGRVTAALRAAGLSPGKASANGLVIPVAATAGRAAAALHTGFARYRLASGRVAVANTSAPLLPAVVARVTQAVLGLNDLTTATSSVTATSRPESAAAAAHPVAAHPAGRVRRAVAAAGPQPCAGAVKARQKHGGWTFDQLARAYSATSLYAAGHRGAGTTIALFELDTWSAGDVSAFQKCYKTNASITTTNVDGGATGKPDVEGTGDIETAIGLAPAAKIHVYEAPLGHYAKSTIDEFTRIVDDDKASVISTSWASCEPLVSKLTPGLAASEDTVLQQAASEGISVFAASGDTGSEGCMKQSSGMRQLAVLDPASQPFVTGVGGTNLSALGPPPAEKVWNTAKDGAGGGGISSTWKKPSWQTGQGVISKDSEKPCPHTATSYCREVPDVSASAATAHGYLLQFGSTWGRYGGTSFAAPLWAALLADIGSQTTPATREGFLNPRLYALPRGTLSDIVSGDNDYTGTHQHLYPATSGFDMASGLGSPNAAKLAKALRPTAGTWKAVEAPAPPGETRDGGLFAVACPSASACAAVGDYQNSAGHQEGLLVTGPGASGTSWKATQVPLPAGAATEPFVTMSSIACASASLCVAVGWYHDSSGNIQGLLVSGSGTSWKATRAPLPAPAPADPQVFLKSVACASPSTCVAAGFSSGSTEPDEGLLLTGPGTSGTSWTAAQAPLPANSLPDVDLTSVACPSASACTVVGDNQEDTGGQIIQQGLLLTGSGKAWSVTTAPLPADAYPFAHLGSVACPSTSACDVAGYYDDSDGQDTHGLLLTGARSSWHATEAPLPAGAAANAGPELTAIGCATSAACLAVGVYDDSSFDLHGLLLNGAGSSWATGRAPLPPDAQASLQVEFTGAACASASRCLAVGDYNIDSEGDSEAALLTGSGTSWTAVRSPTPGGASDDAFLGAIACPSASLCVAVGNYGGRAHDGLLVTGP